MIAFQDTQFQFALARGTLGASYRQGFDIGEVLATGARIIDGDADSWLNEWTATAGAAWASAIRARPERTARQRASAFPTRRHLLRRHRVLPRRLNPANRTDSSGRLWQRQRACWEQIIDLSSVPGGGGGGMPTAPACVFPATGKTDQRRPLVVVNNGSYQPRPRCGGRQAPPQPSADTTG